VARGAAAAGRALWWASAWVLEHALRPLARGAAAATEWAVGWAAWLL